MSKQEGKKKPNLEAEIRSLRKDVARIKVEPETKYIDTKATTLPPNTGVALALCNCVQGVTDKTRIGDTIRVMHIGVRLHWNLFSAATGDFTNFGRCLLIEDLATGGNLPTPSAVLADIYSFITPVLLKRYKVHFDSMVSISLNGPSCKTVVINKEFKKGKLLLYSSNVGTEADLLVRSFFLLVFSDSSVAPAPTFTYAVRVSYLDV